MKLQGRKRYGILSLSSLTFHPSCYVHDDAVMQDFLTASHECRAAAEHNQISLLLLLNHGEPILYPVT